MSAAKPITKKKKPATRSTSFDPDAAKAFGKATRKLREDAGFTQNTFSVAADIDRSYYGKLERGEFQPTLGVILRIAHTLKLSAWEVVQAAEAVLHAPAEVEN